MGKGKPRHNPDKPANKYGTHCPYYEEYCNGKVGCEGRSFYGDELGDANDHHKSAFIEIFRKFALAS